jgi:hypothetical protein
MEPNATYEPAVENERSQSVSELLRSADSDHPALARLRVRLSSDTPVEASITSYDRMHHRHSRQ